MIKSLMSSVLRMTSLGPMVAASSCRSGLGSHQPAARTPRSARRRLGGVSLRVQAELREEELALAIGGPPAGGPHQPMAVGAEHRQPVEAVMIGDPLLGAVV